MGDLGDMLDDKIGSANVWEGDLYVGFANLPLGETQILFPRGISLKPTFAHLMSPMMMAFAPPGAQGHHPGPWRSARGGFGQDITAELHIPVSASDTFDDAIEHARTISFLIRLWSTPALTVPAMANMSFRAIKDADDGIARIIAVEHKQRHFTLSPADDTQVVSSLSWVSEHFEDALRMRRENPEFMLASYAFDTGQFIDNLALVLISLWGALEGLFSPSKTELQFRVSSLIAAYLKPPGGERRAEQKRVATLYNKRSAAAHGKPSHALDDVFRTYELLRFVLIKQVESRKVPTKSELEAMLFGTEE